MFHIEYNDFTSRLYPHHMIIKYIINSIINEGDSSLSLQAFHLRSTQAIPLKLNEGGFYLLVFFLTKLILNKILSVWSAKKYR